MHRKAVNLSLEFCSYDASAVMGSWHTVLSVVVKLLGTSGEQDIDRFHAEERLQANAMLGRPMAK